MTNKYFVPMLFSLSIVLGFIFFGLKISFNNIEKDGVSLLYYFFNYLPSLFFHLRYILL